LQKKGFVAWEEVVLEDALDLTYKPGLHVMISTFLDEVPSRNLCRFEELQSLMHMYQQMAGYTQ